MTHIVLHRLNSDHFYVPDVAFRVMVYNVYHCLYMRSG